MNGKQYVPVEIDAADVEDRIAERMRQVGDTFAGRPLTRETLAQYVDACVLALRDSVEADEARRTVEAVLREKLGAKYDELRM